MEFIKKYKNYIGIFGCALVAIGCLLPFAGVFGIYVKYIEGTNGILVLILAILSAILFFLKYEKYSLITTAVSTIIYGYNFFKVVSVKGANIGIGFFMILIGLVIMIACPLIKTNNQ